MTSSAAANLATELRSRVSPEVVQGCLGAALRELKRASRSGQFASELRIEEVR